MKKHVMLGIFSGLMAVAVSSPAHAESPDLLQSSRGQQRMIVPQWTTVAVPNRPEKVQFYHAARRLLRQAGKLQK
jgi:hypothetical protein